MIEPVLLGATLSTTISVLHDAIRGGRLNTGEKEFDEEPPVLIEVDPDRLEELEEELRTDLRDATTDKDAAPNELEGRIIINPLERPDMVVIPTGREEMWSDYIETSRIQGKPEETIRRGPGLVVVEVMRIVITLVVLGFGIYLLISGSAEAQQWATGALGAVVGYWLR